MLTLRFTETGKEFQVSCALLQRLVEVLPNTENNGELALALVDLGIPSLVVHLLDHKAVYSRHDALWDGGDRGIRQALIKESVFRQRLTDTQAQDIMDMDDREMLTDLASGMDDVLDDDVNEGRLSRRMSDKLARFLRTHEDPRVKDAIVNAFTDVEQLCVPFAECLRLGIDCDNTHTMATMRPADVEQLHTAPHTVLYTVVQWVEHITDAAAQKALLHLLTTHPDPTVRLALADNCEAPREALEALCADADADVARTARVSLALQDADEEDDFDD